MEINNVIALQLEKMAEINAKDKYRKKAYMTAAANIRAHNIPLSSGKQASDQIAGVGKSIADKIDQILSTGQITLLGHQSEEEKAKLRVLNFFKSIHGVSTVTADHWYEHGLRTYQDLIPTFQQGGMTEAQGIGFRYYEDLQLKIPRKEMNFHNRALGIMFGELGINFVLAGSYRRNMEESGDIDILVNSDLKDGSRIYMFTLMDILAKQKYLIGNLTPNADVKFMGVVKLPVLDKIPDPKARRLDIRIIDSKSWPFALLYFTGSKEFNIKMRDRALKFGLSMSEYGFVDQNKDPFQPEDTPFNTEEDVFKFLGIKYLCPEERTSTVELEFISEPVPIKPFREVGQWHAPSNTLLIYITNSMKGVIAGVKQIKVAGFDLDHTLVENKYGHTFTTNPEDLVLMKDRLRVLQDISNQGYMIVIFTNQKSRGKQKREITYGKLTKAAYLLQIPMIMIAALDDDKFRKPDIGMWTQLEGLSVNIDKQNSFYCGDAAGRPTDFSNSDLKFAENVGIKFLTPEQLFGK